MSVQELMVALTRSVAIAKVVSAAPPLTDKQRARLRALLRGARS